MIYAPYVKNLRVYAAETKKYSVSNWRGFITYARGRTLLPHLKVLSLDTQFDCPNQLMWIRAFLSASLVEITVIPTSKNTPMISYLESSIVLRNITALCPNLERLSLFPDSDNRDTNASENEDRRALIDCWDSSLSYYLGHMSSLRAFSSTTEVLMPGSLERIAGLPELNSLSIYPATNLLQMDDTVLKDGFPSLRHLALCSFSHTQVSDIWQLGFFKNLTSLELSFTSCPDSAEPEGQAWGINLMSTICNSSPHLVNLDIDFYVNNLMLDESLFLVGISSLLRPMKKLALEQLMLRGAWFGDYDHTIYRMIPMVWAHLVFLDMPDEQGSPQALYWFSELPNLKRLRMWLCLSTPGPDIMHVSSPRNRCFDSLESSGKTDVVGNIPSIARYVAFLCQQVIP